MHKHDLKNVSSTSKEQNPVTCLVIINLMQKVS